MGKRRDVVWLALLAALIALTGNTLAARNAGPQILWEFSKVPVDTRSHFRLTLESGRLTVGNASRQINVEDQEKLVDSLQEAGLWELRDYDEPSHSGSTIETVLSVQISGRQSYTKWRGVSVPQMRVVDALCGSSIGKEACDRIAEFGKPALESLERLPVKGCRFPTLLETAPAGRVINVLRYAYPDCGLQLHPAENGFYIVGSRRDVLQIKSEIASLDHMPFLR